MERIAREHGVDMAQLDLAAQDALWDAVKVEERGAR